MTKQKFELTYEDAIKALDCCCSLDNKCKQCPVYVVGGTCCSSSILAHFVRKFIEHQEAEIERLKFPKFLVENTLSEKEISEMLKMGRVGVVPHIEYSIKRIDEDDIRAEAINDYIKRLTDSDRYGWYDWDIKECVYTKTDIVKLAKEMGVGTE